MLASAVHRIVTTGSQDSHSDSAAELTALVSRYASNLPKPVCTKEASRTRPTVVLLTGSTGNLGTHILAALLEDPSIHCVYTLNRKSAAVQKRQVKAFIERDLPIELLQRGKIIELLGDVTQDRLGLEELTFREVCEPLYLMSKLADRS